MIYESHKRTLYNTHTNELNRHERRLMEPEDWYALGFDDGLKLGSLESAELEQLGEYVALAGYPRLLQLQAIPKAQDRAHTADEEAEITELRQRIDRYLLGGR